MTLGELINRLKSENPDNVVREGFHNAHSYRGYYEDLAFEPAPTVTVGLMLRAAEDALGQTFMGWKGGDYTMTRWTDVWLANEGECGESIGPRLLGFMLADIVS